MIRLRYTCEGFPTHTMGLLRGTNNITFGWIDLLWAAVSVGKLGYADLLGYGHFSIDEILFRCYLVDSHLMQYGDRIYKSPLYESLDPTEKGAASYFIGMAISKLIGLYLFNVPHLVHFEKIKTLYKVNNQGQSRPDLVGIDTIGNWVIFEAKGRSRGFSRYALNQAKLQTGTIFKISGMTPTLKVATESYFMPYLSVYVADPEIPNNEIINVEINETQLLQSYYSTLREAIRPSPREEFIQNRLYLFRDFESLGISIGMMQILIQQFDSNEMNRSILETVRTVTIDRIDQSITRVYADGTAVSLDYERWSSDNMSLDPRIRRR
jgi:hypothetical protein